MTDIPMRPSQRLAPDNKWTMRDLEIAWNRGDHEEIVAAARAGLLDDLPRMDPGDPSTHRLLGDDFTTEA